MVVAQWSFGLIFSFFTFCACLEENCIVGIVTRPVLLHCYHPHVPLSFNNLSVEWRRDSELVLKAEWGDDGEVALWSLNHASITSDAPLTGNFSLELPKLMPKDEKMNYSLFLSSPEHGSVLLCSLCLRTAARFSLPRMHTDRAVDSNRTVFLCQSSGGFPQPTVYWLINDTDPPPEGSVRTDLAPLSDSNLYNVTSQLTVNISMESSVSCFIQNQWVNETLISKSSGAKDDTFRSRASDGMWMFSTGLCVAVGILVAVGVGYQIHLDRLSKKRKDLYESSTLRGQKKKHQFIEETEEEKLTPKESIV